jgi:hypothetical protein
MKTKQITTALLLNIKTQIISKILLALSLVVVLGGAVTPAHGGTQSSSAPVTDFTNVAFPVVTINSAAAASGVIGSAEVVKRGQIGAFVLNATRPGPAATTFVNFKVNGTAVPGVDYTPLVSPTFIGQTGFGVILVKTLFDPRASVNPQAYTVTVTLEPGPGYAVGQPSAAKLVIAP